MRALLSSLMTLLLFAPLVASGETCRMKMTMDTPESVKQWRAVNDGVMGGLSSGGPKFHEGHMVFEGVINKNGGGFSSIRARVVPGILAGERALKFRIKSDGRAYKATLRTDAQMGWREVSFQAPLSAAAPGEWDEVIVPFARLKASVFGRPVRGAEFDSARVQSIGIILADGQDGPFRLEVAQIVSCKF